MLTWISNGQDEQDSQPNEGSQASNSERNRRGREVQSPAPFKSLFEEFAKDSSNSLASSSLKSEILKCDGNAAWGNLHSFYNKLILGNESYKKLADLLSSDELLVMMYGKDTIRNHILYRFIDNMIILGRDSGLYWLQFNQQVFDKVFDALTQELYDPEWTYVAVSPDISNFRSDLSLIDFGDGIEIRGRTENEIMQFMAWDIGQFQYYWAKTVETWTSSFVLMITEKVKKEPHNLVLLCPPSLLAKKANLVNCLRLFKAGSVAVEALFHSRRSEFFKFWGMNYSGVFARQLGAEYILNSDEVEKFEQFKRDISDFLEKEIKDYEDIALALRYFNLAYTSTFFRPDEMLIDCVTALEALFKIEQELAFRLAFRVAYLLATSNDERVKIFDGVKNFYSLRSRIVHGSKLKGKDLKTLDDIEKLVDYVRRCLNVFINLAKQDPRILTNQFYEQSDIKLIDDKERGKIQKLAGILKDDN